MKSILLTPLGLKEMLYQGLLRFFTICGQNRSLSHTISLHTGLNFSSLRSVKQIWCLKGSTNKTQWNFSTGFLTHSTKILIALKTNNILRCQILKERTKMFPKHFGKSISREISQLSLTWCMANSNLPWSAQLVITKRLISILSLQCNFQFLANNLSTTFLFVLTPKHKFLRASWDSGNHRLMNHSSMLSKGSQSRLQSSTKGIFSHMIL